MSYGRPAQTNKIKINSCAPRDLESIPGVGRKTVDLICNIREAQGNITPEQFATLGIRNLPAAMESIDFEQYAAPAERSRPESFPEFGPPFPHSPDSYGRRASAPFSRGYAPDPDMGYGYQPYATSKASMVDPSYDWRWNQYRPPSPAYHLPSPSQPFRVKSEFDDVSDRSLTPPREVKTETKAVPKVHVPKGISFDGKSDWQAFINKFTSYADREGWNAKTRREVLCWVLEGAASKYYAGLVKRNPTLDYFEVVDKLAKRFDIRDLPETTQMLFAAASQNPKESLIEWCDRVSTLATQAFPDWTDDQITRQTVLRFCQGCSDKEAGFHAINARPKTLEQAVDEIRRFQHSSMAIYGKSRREVRRVEEEEDEEVPYNAARATKFDSNRRPARTFAQAKPQPENTKLVERVDNLEKNMETMKQSMKNIEQAFRALESRLTLNASAKIAQSLGQNQTTPTKPPLSGTKGKPKCFECGEEGHYRPNCPHRKKVREVGDYEEEEDEDDLFEEEQEADLNTEGSEY